MPSAGKSVAPELSVALPDHPSRFRWIPTSLKALEEAERARLKGVKSAWRGLFVPIRSGKCHIWTVIINEEASKDGGKDPLVLVHGFGGGLGLWSQNLDALSRERTVYAFDLLGFGRSSRPAFSHDVAAAEAEWVESIEEWRENLSLGKFILIGHSFGGFLSSSYALEYPDRVRHLVLVDPWGFPEKPPSGDEETPFPIWVRILARIVTRFNPFATLRLVGPLGPKMMRRIRSDFGRRFGDDAIYDYIYHSNAQTPSGEIAFRNLSVMFRWAKRPMLQRLPALKKDVPITFIYGAESWIESGPGYLVQSQLRPESYVRVELVSKAGHHVYADEAEDFNRRLLYLCDCVDKGEDVPKVMVSEGV